MELGAWGIGGGTGEECPFPVLHCYHRGLGYLHHASCHGEKVADGDFLHAGADKGGEFPLKNINQAGVEG